MSNITKAIAALGVVASLGVTALPLSTYADSETSPIPVTAIVDDTIAVTTSKSAIDLGTVMPGGPVSTDSIDVTVTTNGEQGYSLYVRDSDDYTGLYLNGNTTGTDVINTVGVSGAAVGKDSTGWGYRVKGANAWNGVIAYNTLGNGASNPLNTRDFADSNELTGLTNATTTVEFGVSVSGSVKNGTYEGGVVFIATALDGGQ